jgi:hypothetical protein
MPMLHKLSILRHSQLLPLPSPSPFLVLSLSLLVVPIRETFIRPCWGGKLEFRVGYEIRYPMFLFEFGLREIRDISGQFSKLHSCIRMSSSTESFRKIFSPFPEV